LFDLLENAVCIPCPINNNFEFEASLLHKTPAVIHWLPGHSVTLFGPLTIYRPLGWSNWPLGVDIDHFENHWSSIIRIRVAYNNALSSTIQRFRMTMSECNRWLLVLCYSVCSSSVSTACANQHLPWCVVVPKHFCAFVFFWLPLRCGSCVWTKHVNKKERVSLFYYEILEYHAKVELGLRRLMHNSLSTLLKKSIQNSTIAENKNCFRTSTPLTTSWKNISEIVDVSND